MSYRNNILPIFLTVLLLASSMVTACAPVGRTLQRMGSIAYEESVDMDRRIRGYFDTESIDNEEQHPIDKRFCYRTLGEVECYENPLPGQERRLVARQVPPDMFDPAEYPYPEMKPTPPPREGEAQAIQKNQQATDTTVSTPVQSKPVGMKRPAQVAPPRDIPEHRRPRELIPVFQGVDG